MRLAMISITMAFACTRAPLSSTKTAAPVSAACSAPEFRGFDFWIGQWEIEIKARGPNGGWGQARGTQRIESVLGGCAIAEYFAADGPASPWAGRSYSMWQPQTKQWRQTWVDDQGSFLVFSGGLENGAMTLYGEPHEQKGERVQMRMVFLEVSSSGLRWEWQRRQGEGAWDPQIVATYKRTTVATR